MESLLLFRRALASPTMCRFIPALSVPSMPFNAERSTYSRRRRRRCSALDGQRDPERGRLVPSITECDKGRLPETF